jgi:hypothetical protein
LDALFWELVPAHKVVIDVVEALCPGVYSPLLQLNQLVAEATPEAWLAVAPNSTTIELRIDEFLIGHLMRLGQVLLESLSAVANLGAWSPFESLLIASPGFQVKVLRILVTLPVVLAAKGLVARQEGAAVRPLVTLHVFPDPLALTTRKRSREHILQFARPTSEAFARLAGDFVLALVAGSRSKIVGFGSMSCVFLQSITLLANYFENL